MSNLRVKHSSSSREAARNDAGMTLVEMMVTLLIIVGSITAMLLLVVSGLKNQALTERVDRATATTQAVISKARDADFSNLGYYASGDTGSAPAGWVTLPVNNVDAATGATGAAKLEQAVILPGVRAWPPVFSPASTPAAESVPPNGVVSKTNTYVTWVPNADGSTPTSKRVTVVSKWAVSPNALTAACNTGGVRCTTQSLVRAATAADQDPYSGTSPAQMCSPTGKTICEAYIRSGRVLDGATMASLTDTPEQVSDVELFARTSAPTSSVNASWTWKDATGGTYKTVTTTLVGSADGTEWKYVVPADATGSAATTYKGDIRPGAVTVTFTAVIDSTTVTATRGAFWSYSPSDYADDVTASISAATTWCSVAGTGTPVQFAVTGHSYGFTDTTQNPSAKDAVDVIFTVTQGGVTRSVSLPATVSAVVSHDTVINGITVPGSPSATWTVTPPATERCDNRAVTLVVDRASDQTTTPLPLRLPGAVSPGLAAPSLTLSIVQATGAWSASWSTPAGATKFNVETTVAGVPASSTGTATTAAGTLALGQNVTARVQAVAGTMVSPWSSTSTVGRLTATPVVTASLPDGLHVVFAWTATPGATSYTVSYQIASGGWTTPEATTATTYTVNANYSGALVNVRVVGVSPAGSSLEGTKSGTTPLFVALAPQNGWSDFGGGYAMARVSRSSAGVISVSGLVASGATAPGTTVVALPAGFQPGVAARLIQTSTAASTTGARLDVHTDGVVVIGSGASPGWLSLTGIRFSASDSGVAYMSLVLANGWTAYSDPNYGVPQAGIDTLGRTWAFGMATQGTYADGTLLASLPAAQRPGEYLHLPTDGSNAFNVLGVSSTGGLIAKGASSTGWTSLSAMFYASGRGAWNNLALQNSWSNSGGIYSTAQYTKAADGLVTTRGLVQGGLVASGTVVATLPAGSRPSGTLVFAAGSAGSLARVDVRSSGDIVAMENVNTGWLSLDSISFVAEQ